MCTWMVPSILVNGARTNSTVSVLKPGLTVRNTRVITNMARSMEQVLSNGPTVLCILESSITITFTARASTPGQTAENTKENGAIIKCMARAPSPGLMAVNMSVNTLMTRSKATVNSSGPMVAATKVIGKAANNTVRECTLPAKVMKSTESGKMANVSDGLDPEMGELAALNED